MRVRSARGWAVAAAIVAGALMAASPAHATELDTIFLADGGRVRGEIMVEDSRVVSLKLINGETREIPRAQVLRVQYASATAIPAAPATEAAVSVAPARAAVRPAPIVVEEPEDDRPRRRRGKKHRRDTDEERSYSEDRDDDDRDDAQYERGSKSARAMVISGAVLSAVGWAGVVVGSIVAAAGAADGNGDTLVKGGIAAGVALPIGITGSVLVGVGVRKQAELDLGGEREDRASQGPSGGPFERGFQTPELGLSMSF